MNKTTQPFYIVILGLIFCTFHVSLFAQWGVKIGATSSSFYYSDSKPNPYLGYDIDLRPYLGYDIEWVQLGDQKPVLNPYLCIFYNLPLSGRFELQPALSWVHKGVSFNQRKYERIIYKVRISSIEIPLSMAYKFITKEKFSSAFYLGGFAALNINAVKKIASHNASVQKTKIDCFENFEAGYHLGFNFRQRLFERNFLFDIRFFQGLTDLFYIPDDQPSLYYETQKIKSTGLHISLGYAI